MLKISEVQMKWSGAAMWDNGGGLEFVKSKNSLQTSNSTVNSNRSL